MLEQRRHPVLETARDVSPEGYLAELPTLVDEINAGAIAVKPNLMPLSDVEAIWTTADVPGERTVLLPRGSWPPTHGAAATRAMAR